MRPILLVVALSFLGGCANTEWMGTKAQYGYRPEDPCIRCGEKWDQIQRHPFEAQFEAGTLNRKDWQ
jgi:hypothetical protein